MALKKIFNNNKKAWGDSIKENIQKAEEEIYESFGNFLCKCQDNALDFRELSDSELAIINATPLGIKLYLEEGQSFKVKKVTRQNIYIMYFKDTMLSKDSSKMTSEHECIKTHSWSEFPEVILDIDRINVEKAVYNLAKNTALSVLVEKDDTIKKHLKPLVKKISSRLQAFLEESSNESDFEDLNIINPKKQIV